MVNDRLSKPIPELGGLKGRPYFCLDSDGQWHYLSHAIEWVTCPPPVEYTPVKEIERRGYERGLDAAEDEVRALAMFAIATMPDYEAVSQTCREAATRIRALQPEEDRTERAAQPVDDLSDLLE